MKELLYNIKFLFRPIEKRRDYHLSKIRNIDANSVVVDYKKPIDKQFENVIEELQQYFLHLAKLFDLRLISSRELYVEQSRYIMFCSIVKDKYYSETKHWFQNIETGEPIMPNIISIEEYNEKSIKMGVIDLKKVSEIKLLREILFTTLEVCDKLYFRMMAIEGNYQIDSCLQKEMIKKDIKKRLGI